MSIMEAITDLIVPMVWLTITFLPGLILAHYFGRAGIMVGLVLMSVSLWLADLFPEWILGTCLIGMVVLFMRSG